jgi:glycosyltransferase involved in cell wall biosynthesis
VKPARILILTGSHLCRNPRVVKEASSLADAGYSVTVLGARSHRPSLDADSALVAAQGRFRHEQIELLDGPLALLRRARSRIARELVSRAGLQLPAALGPGPALLRAARARSFDLLVAHTEPALWAAARLIDSGHRVAADIEDWHSEDLLPAGRVGRPLALLRQIERDLLHRAAYVTTTSEALAAALQGRYGGQRPEVITNSFPLPALPELGGARLGSSPSLLWFSQTIGPGRGLESFLTAWALTKVPSRLVLVGEDRYGSAERLRAALPASHADRMEIHPLMSPLKLPGFVARHDVGLALEPRDPANRDLTITNKILQYLGAGLAVVATPTTGQREILAHSPDAGILHDFVDPADAARALDALLADRDALRARRLAARRLAETRYCWERESPRLLDLVSRALRL